MKLFENGVGSPSIEIKRKIFMVSIIAVVAIVITLGGVLLFGNNNVIRLKGAAANGSKYMNMSVKNSVVKTDDCKITMPIELKNTQKSKITITSVKITYSGSDTTLSSVKLNKTLNAGKKITQNVTFDMQDFTSLTNKKFKVVVYFKFGGKEYCKYDLYNASSSVMKALNKCKTKQPNYSMVLDINDEGSIDVDLNFSSKKKKALCYNFNY